MSKSRPHKVYAVHTEDGDGPVVVIARHPKGARSVAISFGHRVPTARNAVAEAPAEAAIRAVNFNQETSHA